MIRLLCGVLLLVAVGTVSLIVDRDTSTSVAWAQAAKTGKTDAEIKQEIIRQSIAEYAKNCPCPYSTDRAGRSCGRRSAYSRPGGASPLCYPRDVTPEMVNAYRAARGEKRAPVSGAKREKGL